MKKIIIFTSIICLLFSSCKSGENIAETTLLPEDTTSLTLTEMIEETNAYPNGTENVDIAIFDPFSDKIKADDKEYPEALHIKLEEPKLFPEAISVDDEITAELSEALGKISEARPVLYSNITGFEWEYDASLSKYFADVNNAVKSNDKEEYTYAPIDQEYASDFDELTKQMRAVFTENYISDDELQKTLFEPDGKNVPEYKMIDGKLCARHQYMGVLTALKRDDFFVMSYDGNTADIIAYAESLEMPYDFYIVKLVNSDEYGWRLDSLDLKLDSPECREIIYTALSLKMEKLNKIFGGGNIPENAETIEINGEIYTETDLDMSIKDMKEFFAGTFSPTEFYESFIPSSDYIPTDTLRNNYIEKYISDVYYEKGGIIFRKNSASRYYIPEPVYDPFITADKQGKCSIDDDEGKYYRFKIQFRKADGDIISENVAFVISDGVYDSITDNNYYSYLYIASELPIIEIK